MRTVHQDSFTAANGTRLPVHTPEVGGGYQDLIITGGANTFRINNNAVSQDVVGQLNDVRSSALHSRGGCRSTIDIEEPSQGNTTWGLMAFAHPTQFHTSPFGDVAVGYELRATTTDENYLRVFYHDTVGEVQIAELIASLPSPSPRVTMVLEVKNLGNGSVNIRCLYDGIQYYDQGHTPRDPSILDNNIFGFRSYGLLSYFDDYLVEEFPVPGSELHYARPF